MRRITLAIMGTVAALVLLLSYRTSLGEGVVASPADPAHVVTAPATAPSTAPTGQGPNPGPASSAAPTPAARTPAAPTTRAPAPTHAFGTASVADGAVESTPYGPLQVQVTVSGKRITDVTAVKFPSDQPLSQEINAIALPELRSEALSAQSARIDGVSGATLTTAGYIASLQSALDVLHFAA